MTKTFEERLKEINTQEGFDEIEREVRAQDGADFYVKQQMIATAYAKWAGKNIK